MGYFNDCEVDHHPPKNTENKSKRGENRQDLSIYEDMLKQDDQHQCCEVLHDEEGNAYSEKRYKVRVVDENGKRHAIVFCFREAMWLHIITAHRTSSKNPSRHNTRREQKTTFCHATTRFHITINATVKTASE